MSFFSNIIENLNFRSSSQHDYSKYSDSELRGMFRSDTWGGLPDNERKSVLQEVSNRYCESRGLNNFPTVSVRDMDGDVYGLYLNNRITLDRTAINNPYTAMDAVVHETNHHCQVNGAGYSGEDLSVVRAESSHSGYGRFDEDRPQFIHDSDRYYGMQDLELDSNNAGFGYVSSYHDEFKNDPAYKQYLEDRQSYFQQNKDRFEAEPNYWRYVEKEHINAAFEAHEISETDRDNAFNRIDSDDDRFKNEAFKNADKAEQLLRDVTNEETVNKEDRYSDLRDLDNGKSLHQNQRQNYSDETSSLEAPLVQNDDIDKSNTSANLSENQNLADLEAAANQNTNNDIEFVDLDNKHDKDLEDLENQDGGYSKFKPLNQENKNQVKQDETDDLNKYTQPKENTEESKTNLEENKDLNDLEASVPEQDNTINSNKQNSENENEDEGSEESGQGPSHKFKPMPHEETKQDELELNKTEKDYSKDNSEQNDSVENNKESLDNENEQGMSL